MKQTPSMQNPCFCDWLERLRKNQALRNQYKDTENWFAFLATDVLDKRLDLHKEGLEKFGINSMELYGW